MNKTRARWWLVAALLLLAAPLADAGQAPGPAWEGVWRGTIGELPVAVCLQHRDGDDFGAYYYLRHLSIISLGTLPPGDQAGPAGSLVWTEQPDADHPEKGPLWHLTGVAHDHLGGTWSDGKTTLPIALSPVPIPAPAAASGADDPDSDVCGSLAFSMPRYTKPTITTGHAALDGTGYDRVTVTAGKQFGTDFQPEVETFQLPGTTPAIARVNAALRRDIPTGPDDDLNFQCSISALGANGYDGGASSSTVPEIITGSWMVSRNNASSDCGGAHPNADIAYTTWDLREGAPVAIEDWFNAEALTKTVQNPGTKDELTTITYTDAFRKLIGEAYARARGDDADCLDAVKDEDEWDAHLARDGVAFYPSLPHVVQACAENAVIPYTKLAPYLNARGMTGVASFRAELGAAK
jgi:hypothetical protein